MRLPGSIARSCDGGAGPGFAAKDAVSPYVERGTGGGLTSETKLMLWISPRFAHGMEGGVVTGGEEVMRAAIMEIG